MQPRRIEPRFVERVWGRTDLSPLFGPQDKRIGEVWFPLPGDFPLLVKFIFTSERLSVQVHPRDEYARVHENSRGKTEMWHILSAGPDSTIAVGFRRPVDNATLRAAIADGSIVELLNWIPVKEGETVFTPAGTVHAIGAGIVMCEIQQNSDVTYRLYDYGRPRELHLDKGLDVVDPVPYEGRRAMPVVCEHFVTEMLDLTGAQSSELDQEHLLIPIAGAGTLAGQQFEAGQVWHVPAGAGPVALAPLGPSRILRTRSGSA
jgi:mannose-6-phosphate isomerase